MRAFVSVLGLVVALSSCGEPRSAEDVAELHRLVADGATLLDVRTPAEYAAGHLPHAMLVPVDDVDSRLSEIPRDRPVVVYCRSGRRSALAAAVLRAGGYEVHDLGPMSDW